MNTICCKNNYRTPFPLKGVYIPLGGNAEIKEFYSLQEINQLLQCKQYKKTYITGGICVITRRYTKKRNEAINLTYARRKKNGCLKLEIFRGDIIIMGFEPYFNDFCSLSSTNIEYWIWFSLLCHLLQSIIFSKKIFRS